MSVKACGTNQAEIPSVARLPYAIRRELSFIAFQIRRKVVFASDVKQVIVHANSAIREKVGRIAQIKKIKKRAYKTRGSQSRYKDCHGTDLNGKRQFKAGKPNQRETNYREKPHAPSQINPMRAPLPIHRLVRCDRDLLPRPIAKSPYAVRKGR